MVTVICPECGKSRRITINTGFRCDACKTYISVDGNGKIRSTRPAK